MVKIFRRKVVNRTGFCTHRHAPEANDSYQYSYLYKYEINIPKGAKFVTLPKNNKIKIFAITVADDKKDEIVPLQLLYDDFNDNEPLKLRVAEIVTPELKPLSFKKQPLFSENIDERMMPRLRQYLKTEGLDTVVVKTIPSLTDYADVNSGNNVTATYYPAGLSSKGITYSNQKIDISNILNSKNGVLRDTIVFDNGEGRIVIDLQKPISIDKINLFFQSFRGRPSQTGTQSAILRNRGQQIFSIWASTSGSDFTRDPKMKGWQYVGLYGVDGRSFGSADISYTFKNNLNCRYLMFISDGNWHGTEYIKQFDIFKKK